MKQYNRARERKNLLNSLLKETILAGNGSGRVHAGRQIEGTTSDFHRENDGGDEYQPRGSCPENRRSPAERESDYGSEEKRVPRLHIEDGREHRPRCGDEGQETEGLKKASGDFAECGG